MLLLILTFCSMNMWAQSNKPPEIATIAKSPSDINATYPIVSGEYFFNADPGVGNGTKISFNQSENIAINTTFAVSGINPGFNNLFIRVKDNRGIWSLCEGRIVYVQPTKTMLSQTPLVSGEYFFDTDPGIGKGKALSAFSSSDNISLINQISVAGLTEGFHNLFIRIKDNSSKWSMYEGRIVYVQPNKANNTIDPITKGEYFFNTDPGVGKGIPLSTFSSAEEISIIQQLSISQIPIGTNNLFVRTMNSSGVWSMYIANPVPIVINSVNNIINDGISIYPNPVASEFKVDGIENLKSLDIIDLTGKVYLSKDLVNKESVNVENLQKGIYFVRINTGNAIVKKKLIIN